MSETFNMGVSFFASMFLSFSFLDEGKFSSLRARRSLNSIDINRHNGLTTCSMILDSVSTMQDAANRATQDINSRIASRVRALRTNLGLTLDTLAAKCDVSRSMISLVERGESSPTAVVLEKIASGLGVSLATLFEDSTGPADPVSRRDDRTPWRDPQSGYLRRNISPDNFPSPIQIVEIVLPAGARVAYETGARDVSIYQQIWVQEGNIEVSLGTITYRLSADDCLAMQLNEPTAFRNRTRKPARYVVVVASERSRASRR
jgi:transcriptional regulator with XRE-family HTH domain